VREGQKPRPEITWRNLYVAALFESDPAKLAERIVQAEQALVLRSRELFHLAGDHSEEEHALDDALYALRALRNTYQCPRPALPGRAAAPSNIAADAASVRDANGQAGGFQEI
jgi:hypothetical protein